MKKLITSISILLLVVMFSIQSTAQTPTLDHTLYKGGVTQIMNDVILETTETDTVDILIKVPNWVEWNYSISVWATEISGTAESYLDLYQANFYHDSAFILIPRAASDTIISGTWQIMKTDTDGFIARYLRMIITAKSQAQKVKYNAYIYLTKKP